MAGGIGRRRARHRFRRIVALSGAEGRHDRVGLDSRGRAVDHAVSRVFPHFGFRQASILENNIVQTTGSAGESIAFGVGVTMPAVMILGFELEITRVLVVSVLGGLLGILMMIPLRRAFIVKQHGKLIYPEGTACADVLIIGETGGATAKTVFIGFGIAFVYQFLCGGLKLWKDIASRPLDWFKGATPALEAHPALLGVGYIIGTKIACIMVAGGILQAFVLVPMIAFFGDKLERPRPGHEADRLDERRGDLRDYVRYIGAGAVADRRHHQPVPRDAADYFLDCFRPCATCAASVGGKATSAVPIAICRCEPSSSASPAGRGHLALSQHRSTDRAAVRRLPRCSGSIGWVNLAAAALIVLFGFLFVTVSSRLTGEIGSSIEPDLRHDHRHVAADVHDLPRARLDRAPYRLLAHFGGGGRLHRCQQRRHDLARPQNRLSCRRYAQVAAMGNRHRLRFIVSGDRCGVDGDERVEHGLFHERSPAA